MEYIGHTWFKILFVTDEFVVDNGDFEVDDDDANNAGDWTRITILETRARTTINNTINNEYIVHFWQFVFSTPTWVKSPF